MSVASNLVTIFIIFLFHYAQSRRIGGKGHVSQREMWRGFSDTRAHIGHRCFVCLLLRFPLWRNQRGG